MGVSNGSSEPIAWQALQLRSVGGTKPDATVQLRVSGQPVESTATGKGAVDSAIRAIKKAVPRANECTLGELRVHPLAKGSDDMCKVQVQVAHKGRGYRGFAASAGTVETAAKAFADALNQLSSAP